MADDVKVDTVQSFYDDQYGWVEAHQRKEVSADAAERWIEEGKAVRVADE